MKHLLLLCFATCLSTSTLLAQQNEVTLLLAAVEYQGETRLDDSESVTAEFDRGFGFGVSFSRSLSQRLSAELSVFHLSADGALTNGSQRVDAGSLEITPVMLSAKFHFAQRDRIAPYVGGGAAYVITSDVTSAELQLAGIPRAELDDELTFALMAGVAFPIGARSAVVIDARFIPLDADATIPGDVDDVTVEIDPLFLSLGFQWRF